MGRGHCCHPQYGSQISGTAGVGGQGRWGCIRALEWEGDPITLRTGPRGRQGKAGRPGQCKWSGDRATIHACPVRGWGPAPLLRNTFIGANSRTPGVPAPALRSPSLSSVVSARPSPRPSPGNARGAHRLRRLRRLSHPPGVPLRGRSEPGKGARVKRPPASAGSCGYSALGAHGSERDRAPLSQTRARARQALSPRPRLSFPAQEIGPERPDGVLPHATPSPRRALTTPRLRSSALGAGAAQPPRAASASSSSGNSSGGTRARERGGPGIALSGRAARRGRPRVPSAPRAAAG